MTNLDGVSEALQRAARARVPSMDSDHLAAMRLFNGFYEGCPVLDSPDPIRSSRLALSAGAARVIRTGLDLLGIQTVEQM